MADADAWIWLARPLKLPAYVHRHNSSIATTQVGEEYQGPPNLERIDVTEMAAAMLDQVLNGFKKELLMSDHLVRIGKGVLTESQISRPGIAAGIRWTGPSNQRKEHRG